ncbi:hypothetical protein BGX34_009447 [Mortierella sp. NVP85]|nr:hypothetical protein BGX34_009447 [Mortierella sp. NVP85]
MTTSSARQPLQAFQSRSTDEVANIPAHVDPKTGQYIVLWRDIKSGFEHAKSIWIGKSLVPFLADENLEQITPLRIAYHPHDVLEVVMDDASQAYHANEGRESREAATRHYSQQYQAGARDINTLTRIVETLDIAPANTHNQPLAKYSSGISHDSQSILPAYSSSFNPFQSGNHAIMQSLDQRFDRLQAQMEMNRDLQVQMAQKQERMLQMQQQTLDRLAIIQSSIQAVLTQTYELHEYPIPRLFIVLPKTLGLPGKLKSIFSDQFRLYFLCECGTHTMSEDTKTPHQVHFAKHEGYDLDKPSAFFERYGSYVLTLMNMVKYGITVAGVFVPPLANTKIVEGLDTAQKHLEYLRKNIAPLVDDTINFLNEIKRNNEMGNGLTKDGTEFEQLEALEGADLRQLESYLKVKDEGRVLGNLYRIVTSEGHVKWVCFDHYRATYRETMLRQLQEIVAANQGTYIEETGKVKIKLTSSTLAKQFYDAMVKTRWIQELEITLEWDATMDDLRSLANAVTKSNLARLTVDGTHLKSPALDVVNRTRRFDPIMQLASNGRIQILQLRGFGDFFARVSKSSLMPSSKLRELSVESELPSQDKAKSLKNFTELYSSLTTLEMRLHQEGSMSDAISTILNKLTNLESLQLDRGTLSARMKVAKSKLHEIIFTADRLEDINSDDLRFQKDSDTNLAIKCNSQSWNDTRLTNILRTSDFIRMRTKHEGGYYFAVAATPGWNLQDLVEMGSARSPSRLESLSIKCRGLTLTAGYSQGKIQDMALRIKRLGDLSSDDLTFIQRGHLTRLEIEETLQKANKSLLVEALGHNPRLTQLQSVCKEGHRYSTVTDHYMQLQDLVKLVTSDTLPGLDLSVSCGNVSVHARTSHGTIQDMGMTIEQLSRLGPDDLAFIQQGHLTRLAIRDVPSKISENQLAQILLYNPKISHLHIGRKEEPSLAIASQHHMRPQELVKMVTSNTLSNFESLLIEYGSVSITGSVSCNKIREMTMTIECLDNLGSDDFSFIEQGHLTRLVISETSQEIDKRPTLLHHLLHHNPALTHLQIEYKDERPVTSEDKNESDVRNIVELVTSKGQLKLESLRIDSKEISFTAGVLYGRLKDVELTVARIENLGSAIGFDQQQHLTRLAIRPTPQEGQLTYVLHYCPSLTHLQVGCNGERSLAMINLVVSEREKILKDRGSFSLRVFDLMGENLAPFDVHADRNAHRTHIQSHLSFSEDTKSFDMRTWIRLQRDLSRKDADPVYAFVRQYGWSIVFFNGFFMDGNIFDTILKNIPDSKSQLQTLWIHQNDCSNPFYEYLTDIIGRSPDFRDLGLFTNVSEPKKLKSLLDRHRTVLSKLQLEVDNTERWSWILSEFPTRSSFPTLEFLEIISSSRMVAPSTLISWVIAMVSAPPPVLGSPSPSQRLPLDVIYGKSSRSEAEPTRLWRSLKVISLVNLTLQPEGWRAVIDAIDFSALERMDFQKSNFLQKQFELLIEHFFENKLSNLPLKAINYWDEMPGERIDPLVLRNLEKTLQNWAPMVEIAAWRSK